MSDYTPSLTKIRAEYAKRGLPPYTRGRGAEFDRAIAKVKADAWDEGAKTNSDYLFGPDPTEPTNPYRTP